jgi:outer membrane autotransporter protein
MLAMPAAAFNSDIARIHSRLDQRRYDGAEPLRDNGEYEFFALAQSDFAENASVADAPNFDYNLYGVTAGFDWKPNYETTLGLALGYTYGKAKVHNSGGKINMDDMRVTAFASRLFGNCYVDAGVQAGMATFDSRRQTFAGATSGDTDSIFAGTFVTVGSVFVISQDKKNGSGLYFTPSVGLSYLHTKIDGFRETGTAGLVMDDAEGDSLRARVAAAVQWSFPLDNWQMRLGLEVAYSHDFLGEELDMDGRFAAGGSKFSASGKALPTDIFSFGPTVDILVSERSSIYFGYGIDVDTDSGISQNVNAGFRHRF